MTFTHSLWLALLLLVTACGSNPEVSAEGSSDFGVLLMAHGGESAWNEGVLAAVEPLEDKVKIEVAFGMADAVSIQEALERLEARGAKRIGVVRLFISGDSWYERTQQILGVLEGAPTRPTMKGGMHGSDHGGHGGDDDHGGHGGHSMEFWRAKSAATFALSTEGLAEADAMGAVLATRAESLSSKPESEDVLILAHGPANDAENQRWITYITARAQTVQSKFPFRRVEVMTLREDWPDKREAAERRIVDFVKRAKSEDGAAIVIPFRVHGFGPYADVLEGLDYLSSGQGLIPHPSVTEWIDQQIESLRGASFQTQID